MERRINIIALDVPYPPDYGGVIDIYYSVKALHQMGFKIHLHCFSQSRSADLSAICEEYFIYQRLRKFSLSVPYIIYSRQSRELEERLMQNDYPILFHGLHTTAILQQDVFRQRQNFLRMHNIEAIYYEQLALNEKNRFRKKYYELEATLLRKYEPGILKKVHLIPLSGTDAEWVQKNCKNPSLNLVPCFVPWQEVESKPGRGSYLLYQGNLSVVENETAVIWLIDQVGVQQYPFIVAGKQPSRKLQRLCSQHANIRLIANPSNLEMDELIRNAQLVLLPSFNKTGIKLKLLHALFYGRHILANADAVAGSGVHALCNIHNSVYEFKEAIKQLWKEDFTTDKIIQRKEILLNLYNNKVNAQDLEKIIFGNT